MHQGPHTGIPPALGHGIEIRIEVAEHDVAVRINQRRLNGRIDAAGCP
jgi:hypothetical protein